MLKLDLKETERTAALVLAAVVADQVASERGFDVCVTGLADGLALEAPDATDIIFQVFVVHLQRRVGLGFLVEQTGTTSVRLDLARGEEEGEEEPVEDTGDVDTPPPPKKRGRPPGSKNRQPEA